VVARLMWDNDCGVLPVVAQGGVVVGLITDRDICMAAAIKHRHLENIVVEEVSSGKVISCQPQDDVRNALKAMQENKIRRLPVVAGDGSLAGIISINDIVLRAQEAKGKKPPDVSYADVISAYKAICEHRLPQAEAHLAAGV